MNLINLLQKRAEKENLPFKIILKESLQFLALTTIYEDPLSTQITFQGGTCLRFLYGGIRYSEDLDFVTPLDEKSLNNVFERIKDILKKKIFILEGEIEMRIQKKAPKLSRWKIYFMSFRKLFSTSFTIELANYPSYTQKILPLRTPAEVPSIPFMLIRAESEEEILADKIVAIGGRKYIKGRDIFDIWMLVQRNINPDIELIRKKLSDYSVSTQKLKNNIELIQPDIVKREMSSFLPIHFRRQIESDNYQSLTDKVKEICREILEQL